MMEVHRSSGRDWIKEKLAEHRKIDLKICCSQNSRFQKVNLAVRNVLIDDEDEVEFLSG